MILKHIEFYIPHRSGEKREKFEKGKEFGFQKKVSAPNPIPKLNLGFNYQYQNRISVSHYSIVFQKNSLQSVRGTLFSALIDVHTV